MRLLFLDTETGGLDPQNHSLLEIGMVVFDEGGVIKETHIRVLDEVIRFTPESLRVNRIDFIDFLDKAKPYEEALREVRQFLIEGFGSGVPVTICGHNVGFDVAFMKKFMGDEYSKWFSHRSIDTASILKYLFMAGLLPRDISASDDALSYFGITVPRRHCALDDARATAELFRRLVDLARGGEGTEDRVKG